MAGQTVVLVPHDPQWRAGFERHASAVRLALGDATLSVEHIGSTAVPGLVAKPIVDMLLVVAHPEDENAYVPRLTEQGFVLHRREPEFDEHRLLKGKNPAANVHVFGPWAQEVERHLIFRDLLRRDAESRAEYEAEKQRLALRDWPTVNDYALAKTDVVERLIDRARAAAGPDGIV